MGGWLQPGTSMDYKPTSSIRPSLQVVTHTLCVGTTGAARGYQSLLTDYFTVQAWQERGVEKLTEVSPSCRDARLMLTMLQRVL